MRVHTWDCECMHVCMFLWIYVAFEKGCLSIQGDSWWDSSSPGRATLDGQVLQQEDPWSWNQDISLGPICPSLKFYGLVCLCFLHHSCYEG